MRWMKAEAEIEELHFFFAIPFPIPNSGPEPAAPGNWRLVLSCWGCGYFLHITERPATARAKQAKQSTEFISLVVSS